MLQNVISKRYDNGMGKETSMEEYIISDFILDFTIFGFSFTWGFSALKIWEWEKVYNQIWAT